MNTKKVLCALAFCFSIAALCFAADDNMMGTWKLNDAKSKISSGTAKNHTVMYEAAGDSIKVTVDGEAIPPPIRAPTKELTRAPCN